LRTLGDALIELASYRPKLALQRLQSFNMQTVKCFTTVALVCHLEPGMEREAGEKLSVSWCMIFKFTSVNLKFNASICRRVVKLQNCAVIHTGKSRSFLVIAL